MRRTYKRGCSGALCLTGGGFVDFDWGKRLRPLGIGSRFCGRALCWAVLNVDAQALDRAVLN